MSKSIYTKLINVQNELKAPKSQYNSFGKYHYRNQEDILESVKPLLLKHNLTLFLKDEITLIGERYYLKATCILIDTETGESVENSALARESENKKGMDDSQITGSTSSYARKYALNGLFLIDDTKDADYPIQGDNTNSNTKPPEQRQNTSQGNPRGKSSASEKQLGLVNKLITELSNKTGHDREKIKSSLKARNNVGDFNSVKDMTVGQASASIKHLQEWLVSDK